MTRATAVYVVDSSDFDSTGDEFACWDVYLGDDDGEPVDGNHRMTQTFRSWAAAMRFAETTAAKRGGLEVVAC